MKWFNSNKKCWIFRRERFFLLRFLIVFFSSLFQTLCEPQEYKPMLHKEHAQDLRHFRAKSKSFTVGDKRKKASRLSFWNFCLPDVDVFLESIYWNPWVLLLFNLLCDCDDSLLLWINVCVINMVMKSIINFESFRKSLIIHYICRREMILIIMPHLFWAFITPW